MPLIVNELSRRNLDFPVLIGGAAINQRFGRRILLTEDESFYKSGVFYCKDAFEGLAIMDALTEPTRRNDLLTRIRHESEMELGRSMTSANPSPATGDKSTIQTAVKIPIPNTWGIRSVEAMPLDVVFQHLSKNELFRLSWGAKNTHGADWEKLKKEFESRLEDMRRQVLKEGWLKPRGVYGIFPCQSIGNELIIYSPESVEKGAPKEETRFSFPRQDGGENLCLADYFAPVDTGKMDTVAFQIVTVGQEASERFDHLQSESNYSEAYYVHGFAVQMAEAAADYLHNHIRKELGLEGKQGKRYSWGYPAVPDLEDHQKVFKLLPVEKELGMKLTEAYQLIPEQSTAAMIVHHPQAKYFNVGESRIQQLMKS
jgi:5-methyltetrahydrofolate--homocysteine methyltransferase